MKQMRRLRSCSFDIYGMNINGALKGQLDELII